MSEPKSTDVPQTHSRATEVLRWICVIPAAWLASWVVRGLGPFLLSLGGLLDLRSPNYPEFLFPLTNFLPSGAAFSFVGAMVAPRARLGASVILAVFCIAISCVVHVLTQVNPGLTNYMHVTGEALGVMIGAACVARFSTREQYPELSKNA